MYLSNILNLLTMPITVSEYTGNSNLETVTSHWGLLPFTDVLCRWTSET